MKELLNKPIFEQLYNFRKEDFEQSTYESDQELRKIENDVLEKEDAIIDYLKQFISEENYSKIISMLNDIGLAYGKQTEYWMHIYYNLGISDVINIRKTIHQLKEKEDYKQPTFLDFSDGDFNDYVYRNADFTTEGYKKLRKKYNEIAEKYSNVILVHEQLKPIMLNKEEMKALVKLREIELEMSTYEMKLCFKLGMKEVIGI